MGAFGIKIVAYQRFAGNITAFCTALGLNLLVAAALICVWQMFVRISCFICMFASGISLWGRRKIIDFPIISDEIIVSFVKKDRFFWEV